MDERLEVLSQVNNLDRFFIIQQPTPGLPLPDKTIYNSPEFIQWKENAKYQLRKLKPSQTVDETIDLLDSFKGWRDKSDLKKLKAKIQIILDNPDDFLPKEDFEETMNVQRLKKGTVVHTAFDDYELFKQVGQGGNGKVFSAKDSKGYDVAIKFVERNETDKSYKRLKNEIHFCEKAQHKNIIKITDRGYAVLDEKPYVFYVMPLYPDTLRSKMKKGLAPEDAIAVFVGIMQGLKFAHEKGTFHRDIKPENILFAENSNEPVICDFGIAHFAEDDLITAVETKAADRLANFQYAAPEQRIKGGAKQVDGRADVYAAGLILNEMFTNEIPQSAGYKKIAAVNPDYAYLDKLFESLFQQNPDDRLFPAIEILNQLTALADYHHDEERKIRLAKVIIEEKEIQEFKPSIIRKSFNNGNLVFVFDRVLPREWVEILMGGHYGHTSLMGYETYCLSQTDENTLIMPLKGRSDEATIKTIVEYMNTWIPSANYEYNSKLKREAAEVQRKEEMKRKKELEEIDRAQAINALLNDI